MLLHIFTRDNLASIIRSLLRKLTKNDKLLVGQINLLGKILFKIWSFLIVMLFSSDELLKN